MKTTLDAPGFVQSWLMAGLTTVFFPLLLFFVSRRSGISASSSNSFFQGYSNSVSGENTEVTFKECSFLWGCQYEKITTDDDAGVASKVLWLVYAMTATLYLSIVYYGYRNSHQAIIEGASAMLMALLVSGFMSLCIFLTTGSLEGLVSIEGEEFRRHGWFGQVAVLYCLTTLLWTIFSFAFVVAIRTKIACCCYNQVDTIDDYRIHEEPSKRFHLPDKTPNAPKRMGRSDSMPGKVALGRPSTQRPGKAFRGLRNLFTVTEHARNDEDNIVAQVGNSGKNRPSDLPYTVKTGSGAHEVFLPASVSDLESM